MTIIASSSAPDGYGDWFAYISNLPSTGVESVPTFNAANSALGEAGTIVLGITAFMGIFTGLLGNLIASSRVVLTMAREEMLPSWFKKVNEEGNPTHAIIFLVLISIIIPFFGRTAISWIVDVTTIGAIIVYTYVSICCVKVAREEKKKLYVVTGVLGFLISLAFLLYFLLPDVIGGGGFSTESYLILILWSILGLIYFLVIYKKDKKRQYGNSVIAWVVIVFLIILVSIFWTREKSALETVKIETAMKDYYATHEVVTEMEQSLANEYISKLNNDLNQQLFFASFMQMIFISISLVIIFIIYGIMMKRDKELEIAKIKAEESNSAKSSFLSNMSHDIRTPMNAIVGYTSIAKEENDIGKIKDYLDKINASSHHLLTIINDVLDMSRIENGKMELDPVETNIVTMINEIADIFTTQMQQKHIEFNVNFENIANEWVVCDKVRLSRIVLNLLSNAYKFTPENGKVELSLKQDTSDEGKCTYCISVKDNGIGMSKEFAEKIFTPFEREKDSRVNKIQGTGLGMSITKSFVDLMGGNIELFTEKDKGSEFLITLVLDTCEGIDQDNENTMDEEISKTDFSNIHVLIVDDNEINVEICSIILEKYHFQIDTAANGLEAFNKIKQGNDGQYQIILMDMQMPIMNGFEATHEIRNLDRPVLAKLPIIALSANAFEEDIQKALDAGANAHASKPIDIDQLIRTIYELLKLHKYL